MAGSTLKRNLRRVVHRTKNWGTIVALTLRGNSIEKRAKLQGCKRPVLLIYGFGATRRTFSILERRLYKDGFTVFSINLGGVFGTFNTNAVEELAALIDQKIEKVYKKYQIKGKLSVIAHSKGGLIGHYYIKRLGGDRRAKLLVTLGTPHNGNPWALLALFTPAGLFFKSVRQMTPMSAFIRRLKTGPFPKKVKLYSIYSQDDRVCLYPGGIVEPADNVKNVEVKGISHSEFLIKKSVYHLIKHALDDNMPTSIEQHTQKKVRKHLQEQQKKAKEPKLKIIYGKK